VKCMVIIITAKKIINYVYHWNLKKYKINFSTTLMEESDVHVVY
jgi:hypothetical protein